MLSAVVFLTNGVLPARFARRKRVKIYVVAAAVAAALLVGLTRTNPQDIHNDRGTAGAGHRVPRFTRAAGTPTQGMSS